MHRVIRWSGFSNPGHQTRSVFERSEAERTKVIAAQPRSRGSSRTLDTRAAEGVGPYEAPIPREAQMQRVIRWSRKNTRGNGLPRPLWGLAMTGGEGSWRLIAAPTRERIATSLRSSQ